jgi:hypothetical protein
MLSVIAEIDSRGTAAAVGYRSTAELVRAIARVPRSEARSRVDVAADVLPGRGLGGAPVEPRLPETAAAVADHAIGAADRCPVRPTPPPHPPHRLVDRHDQRHPPISLTTLARPSPTPAPDLIRIRE